MRPKWIQLIVMIASLIGGFYWGVSVLHAESRGDSFEQSIFDDAMLLDGYTQRYQGLSKDVIVAMIKDDTLNSYQGAAAIRTYKELHSAESVSREKNQMEKILIRRLKLTDSAFVQVEALHTLCRLDRYRYFKPMVPALIQKLDHYNATVNEIAFNSLNDIVESGNKRAREARIVFNVLRKILFLSRKRLASLSEPDPKLARKLKLLRWSIKILGRQELDRLPKEVIHLL